MRISNILAVGALLVALSPPGLAFAATIASGAYDNTLMLAADPASGRLTGYFDMSRGEGPGPTFSCIFYISGRASGARATIDTYFPDDPNAERIKGQVTAQAAGKVRVALASEHGGCANVWPFADKDQPADFELQKAYPWTQVRVAKAPRVYFYPAPGAAAHGRAYVVQGDGLGVRAAKPGWVQADYAGGDKLVSGWVREADLYAAP